MSRVKFAMLGVLVALTGILLAPVANAARPADPSPYCRPYLHMPYTAHLARAGGGHYTATIEGVADVDCNGPANITVTAILHYSTNPSQGGNGAQSGPTTRCYGSCSTTATHTRNLFCGYHYTFSDYTQITGTWSGGGESGKLTGDSSRSSGSAYNPRSVCS